MYAAGPSTSPCSPPVPLENRIQLVTCVRRGQAARVYSLIRPLRTGFRRIRSASGSVVPLDLPGSVQAQPAELDGVAERGVEHLCVPRISSAALASRVASSVLLP